MTVTPRLVCFDLGGVLIRICRSWSEACALAGFELRRADLLASQTWMSRRKAIIDRYQRGALSTSAYLSALSEAVEGLYTPSEIEQIHEVWTQDPYPGAEALIDALLDRPDVRIACLSNTNDAHWQRLTRVTKYRLLTKLHHTLASHELRCLKPEPEIYRLAHDRFSAGAESRLSPQEVIFFDDLEDNIAAARRFGWQAWTVDPLGDPVKEMQSRLSVRDPL